MVFRVPVNNQDMHTSFFLSHLCSEIAKSEEYQCYKVCTIICKCRFYDWKYQMYIHESQVKVMVFGSRLNRLYTLLYIECAQCTIWERMFNSSQFNGSSTLNGCDINFSSSMDIIYLHTDPWILHGRLTLHPIKCSLCCHEVPIYQYVLRVPGSCL